MDGEGVEWPAVAASRVRVKRGKCKADSPAVEEARLASKQGRKEGRKEARKQGRKEGSASQSSQQARKEAGASQRLQLVVPP